jgi:hypothetical protein
MRKIFRNFSWLCLLILLSSCARQVTIRPPISSSLGYVVFKELAEIHRAPLHVGLLIENQLQELIIQHSGELGTAEVPIGQVLAAKIIKLVSYKFERITLIEDRNEAIPILMHMSLQGEQPSVGVEIDKTTNILTGATTFDVIAKVDLRLRATLTDNGETIWIGTARLVEQIKSGGAAYGVLEGATQTSDITNRITDALMADLAQQMRRSQNLQRYLEERSR